MTVFLRSGNPAGSGITNKVNLVANDIGYNNLLHEGATTNHYPLTMDATDNNKGVRIYTIFNTTYDGDDLTFETYLTDKEVRRAIEDKKFQRLGTEIPSYTFADLKRLGQKNMNSVVGYVNDNVNLSRFM